MGARKQASSPGYPDGRNKVCPRDTYGNGSNRVGQHFCPRDVLKIMCTLYGHREVFIALSKAFLLC